MNPRARVWIPAWAVSDQLIQLYFLHFRVGWEIVTWGNLEKVNSGTVYVTVAPCHGMVGSGPSQAQGAPWRWAPQSNSAYLSISPVCLTVFDGTLRDRSFGLWWMASVRQSHTSRYITSEMWERPYVSATLFYPLPSLSITVFFPPTNLPKNSG